MNVKGIVVFCVQTKNLNVVLTKSQFSFYFFIFCGKLEVFLRLLSCNGHGAQPEVQALESPYSTAYVGVYRYQLLISFHCNQVRPNPIFVLASFQIALYLIIVSSYPPLFFVRGMCYNVKTSTSCVEYLPADITFSQHVS